jgi:hypothetical protein
MQRINQHFNCRLYVDSALVHRCRVFCPTVSPPSALPSRTHFFGSTTRCFTGARSGRGQKRDPTHFGRPRPPYGWKLNWALQRRPHRHQRLCDIIKPKPIGNSAEIYNTDPQGVERMLRCIERYPEGENYSQEWFARLPRSTFQCADASLDSAGAYASRGKILLTQSVFENFLNEQDSALNTFEHEVFHGTGANNQCTEIHNQEAGRGTSSVENCDSNDRLNDRVYILSGLCFPDKTETMHPYAHSLYQNMNHCGIDRCVETFSSGPLVNIGKIPIIGIIKDRPGHLLSTRLSQKESRSLCEKIYQEGECLNRLQQSPNLRARILQSEPIREVRSRILNHLQALKPQINMREKRVFLPKALLSTFRHLPSAEEIIQENQSCFENSVQLTSEGLILQMNGFTHPPMAELNERSTLRNVQTLLEPPSLPQAQFQSKQDQCPDAVRNLESALSFRPSINTFFHDLASDPDNERRSPSEAPFTELAMNALMASRVNDVHGRSFAIESVLGEELFKSLTQKLETIHPDSAHFNCSEQNFAPTLEEVIELLQDLGISPQCTQ